MFLELFGLVWTGEHFFLLPSGEPALGDKGFQLPESILFLDRNASATGKQGSLQIITNAGMSLAATARGGAVDCCLGRKQGHSRFDIEGISRRDEGVGGLWQESVQGHRVSARAASLCKRTPSCNRPDP